jgi:hypothetical protein
MSEGGTAEKRRVPAGRWERVQSAGCSKSLGGDGFVIPTQHIRYHQLSRQIAMSVHES